MEEIKSPADRLTGIYAEMINASKPQEAPKTEQKEVTQSSTEAPVEQAAKVETPTPATQVGSSTEDFDVNSWDETPEVTEAPKPTAPVSNFDFNSFVKDIGFEESEPEKVKQRIKELTSKPSELEGLPEPLKKAIEFAKQGADYLSYLKINSVDYGKLDPVQVYEQKLFADVKEMNPNATPEQLNEAFSDELSKTSQVVKYQQGKLIRDQYVAYQRQQEQEYDRAVQSELQTKAAKKAEADAKLIATVEGLSEIGGLKLKANHKQDMVEAIRTGRMQKELFFNEKGEYDYKNMAEVYFLKKNLDKILNHISKTTQTKAKKEVLDDLQNAQIKVSSEKPDVKEEKRSALEIYTDTLRANWSK